MGYDYLLTLIKVIVGLITPQRMMYIALITFGVFLLWVILSLVFSFQRKFYANSVKLYSLLKNSTNSANNADLVKKYSSKISSGFEHGWNRFSAAEVGKPSDYITRYDSLDSGVNGGVLNQGKSIMKSFIWLMTVILLVVNLAYHGGENAITFSLIVEAAVLPILFFCVLKVFYYLYTIIRQQLYKLDIECYYDLIELLDSIFEKKDLAPKQRVAETFETSKNTNFNIEEAKQNFSIANEVQNNALEETLEEESEESSEEESEGDPTENLETESEAVEENSSEQNERYEEDKNLLDKYDIFKKKNIDVNSLNEVPASSKTLPFINVDSDYVIKDDEDPNMGKRVSTSDNGSTVLGVIQDMSSVKKAQENEQAKPSEEPVEEIEKESTENDLNETEDVSEESVEETAENEIPENLEVEESTEEAEKTVEEIEELVEEPEADEDDKVSEIEESAEESETDDKFESFEVLADPIVEPEDVVEESAINNETEERVTDISEEEEVSEENDVEEVSEEEKLASIVGGFKSNNSKLANGGVVIERSSPITRRNSRSTTLKEFMFDNGDQGLNEYATPNYSNGLNGYNNPSYGANYMSGGVAAPYQNQNNFAGQQNGLGENYDFNKFPSYNKLNELYNSAIEENGINEEKITKRKAPEPKKAKPAQNPKAALDKKPVSSNKPSAKEIEDMDENSKRRGRPKKQVFDDEVTITSDKEFNDVLSRAEKLMRKSEEGLSASQSKRIEKELKMLMDAMNKYKEKR